MRYLGVALASHSLTAYAQWQQWHAGPLDVWTVWAEEGGGGKIKMGSVIM